MSELSKEIDNEKETILSDEKMQEVAGGMKIPNVKCPRCGSFSFDFTGKAGEAKIKCHECGYVTYNP